MGLIHHEQSQIFYRGKKSGACPNGNSCLAIADAMPFVVTLSIRKARMQNAHTISETGAEPIHCLGREGNFWDEHDGSLTFFEGMLNGLKIDLGFSASGYAMKQHHRRLSLIHRGFDFLERLGLFRH